MNDTPAIRVVVCEDQAVVRAGFVTILSAQADIDVVGEAADGRSAVAVAQRLEPDVVVMDVRMPLLDGIEATRRLAGPGARAPLTVLVVTTFNVDEYVYEALRAGASGFLLKDARPSELADAVRHVARGEALLAPSVTRSLVGRFAERVRPDPGARSPERERLGALTTREYEVFLLVGQGLSNAEIAARLVVSPETVKTYVSRMLTKLDLRDRVQAVILGYRTGVLDGPGDRRTE
ncbi:response regulator transcription factor [Phycicoccus sp. CSK15P-2]|uniref:response regulator transcription factor n=1 Tax=Phycicoccus sp. CSK15P-2 TaxID=2807627 RepID=UPI00194F99DF|nr:response regulator transcription factor [Phycicoccus sp. CSK15P-2]MBM6404482.1 response regulator transcription factor [Phycicoccus sp. CSK15P-2]